MKQPKGLEDHTSGRVPVHPPHAQTMKAVAGHHMPPHGKPGTSAIAASQGATPSSAPTEPRLRGRQADARSPGY